MQTFLIWLNEAAHEHVPYYKDWGVVHPRTGQIISGKKSPLAKSHEHLLKHLEDTGKIKQGDHKNYVHYAHVDHAKFGGKDKYGYLKLSNVNAHNRSALMKSYNELPHHQSGQVEMVHHVEPEVRSQHVAGTRLQIQNINRAECLKSKLDESAEFGGYRRTIG